MSSPPKNGTYLLETILAPSDNFSIFNTNSYRWAGIISSILLLYCVIAMINPAPVLGQDFLGGTVITVQAPADLNAPAGVLDDILDEFRVGSADINAGSTDGQFIISLLGHIPSEVVDALQLGALEQGFTIESLRILGPAAGAELRDQGGIALIVGLFLMMIYVGFRFQWRFGVAALAAIVHDVAITLGVLTLLRVPLDLTVVAGLLALIGYSVNDTIVVFDRIREVVRRKQRRTSRSIVSLINTAIHETMSRTMVTSGTTLLVVASMALLGGPALFPLAITLVCGVIVGTYSSIYIAPLVAVLLQVKPDHLQESVRQDGQGTTDAGRGAVKRSSLSH